MTVRDELLERLLVSLTTASEGALPMRERALHDPTVALLDAWATAGAVLGFYADRIEEEGYLGTAREPGSILALAELVGHRPQPGVAARVHLAYSLNADPDDKAVLLAPRLLSQTVPGPGEQPQTFETTDQIVARPSWNVMAPRRTRPLTVATAADAKQLTTLVVSGVTANLATNDAILLDVAGAAHPAVVRVASARADLAASHTIVSLQAPPPPPPPGPPPMPPSDVTGALDRLLDGGLATAPAPVPASPNRLPREAKSVFAADSDALPRLLATLRPAVAPTLYQALDTTALGTATVTGAAALRVKAAPFGAQAPARGPGDDWPIGDAHTLTLSAAAAGMVPGVRKGHAGRTVFDITCQLGELTGHAALELDDEDSVPLGDLGSVTLTGSEDDLVLHYTGSDKSRVGEMTLTKQGAGDLIHVELAEDGLDYAWDPRVRTPIHVRLGGRRLSIVWTAFDPVSASVSISIETPLPLLDRKVLPLDAEYPAILAGGAVVIERGGETVVAHAKPVESATISRYGLTARVTQLELDREWIGEDDVSQAVLRDITVRAQPDPLGLEGLPIDTDLGDDTIELDGLVAGMEPGRLVIVAGTRTALPGGAAVPGGELAMVAAVTNGGANGETAHTTLHLASPLAYRYARDTVKIYGNVVAARQGATIDEVLGSGQAGLAGQTLTLTSGPLLADPAPTPGGARSTLTVTVDGVGYEEVERFGATTPPRSFVTGTDASGRTTIAFAAPLPAGRENVRASYRAGDGRQGNARAGQVTQLLSRPAGVAAVTNPLPGSGGSGGDGPEAVRHGAAGGLSGLGRVVTVSDYADLASARVDVGKAAAELVDGRVLVTLAGPDPVSLDPQAAPCTTVAAILAEAADPTFPAVVLPADLFVILLQATVTRDPLVGWDETVDSTRAALLRAFGYAARALGDDVALGDLIAAAHSVPAVLSFTVTSLALVPAAASASALASKLPALLARPVPQVSRLSAAAADWSLPAAAGRPAPRAVAYLSDSASDTLLLREHP